MNALELRELDVKEMKQVEGGSFWSGCASGAASALVFPITRVAGLALWQVGALIVAGGCIAGGLDDL